MKDVPDRFEEQVDSIQETVADVITWIVRFTVLAIVVTFLIYAFGLRPASIHPEQTMELWEMSSREMRDARDLDGGWAWILALGDAINLSFSSLALFPAMTIAVTLVISLLYARRRIGIHAALALCQVILLVIAATGVANRGL